MTRAPAGVAADTRIPPELRQAMVLAIDAHRGAEVLFVCDQDDAGHLTAVDDVAHGNRGMVPVLSRGVQDGQVLIHNHPSGRLEPSEADIRAAAVLADRGIGSWIVDSAVERIYVVAEARATPKPVLLDPVATRELLGETGPLARRFPGYTPRPAQQEMVERVSRAFNDNVLVAIEAGTGVGKSFAYLIPAMVWAASNNERVVISTATINLQQQLFGKDIPAVLSLLGLDLKAVLAKGRGNYLCVKRLGEALDEEDTLLEQDGPFQRIKEWSRATVDGSRSDLPFLPEDGLWSRVNADADACPGMRCPDRDACFFFRARREAASARIIVANHHLVLADAAMRSKGFGFDATVVLPAFQRLILDEAHGIDDAATSFFSDELNRFTVLKYLALLQRRRQNRAFGLLPALSAQGLVDIPQAEAMLNRVKDAVFHADSQALILLGEAPHLRLAADGGEGYSMLFDALAELQAALLALSEALGDAVEDSDEEEAVPALEELALLARRLGALAAVAESFRAWQRHPDRVYYLERIRNLGGDSAVQFIASPLEVGPLLAEAIFKPYRTVVMTSATLQIRHSFDFFLRRVGLWTAPAPLAADAADEWRDDWGNGEDDEAEQAPDEDESGLVVPAIDRELRCSALESPFDYRSRVLLGVAADGPEPQSPAFPAWIRDFVAKVLRASGGHGLVLFTSYDLLRQTYEHVRPLLEAEGISAYRQGSEERSRLLQRFNADMSSCLFATDSFWEGVDSPGDTLQVVILCRLPFKVPTDPLMLARSERIEARGGSAFMEISVPEAVMKLRQGFGRLMRHEKDHGVVLIADRRVVSKSYGRSFLDSLPPARRLIAPADELIRETERFLDQHRTRS